MITINEETFYDKPGSCGTCPFFFNAAPSRLSAGSAWGHCRLFNENHRSWINPPPRCRKIFNKAFRHPDGSRLVIVAETQF